jgi:hypothetical protein
MVMVGRLHPLQEENRVEQLLEEPQQGTLTILNSR